eukprot:CAMPEP_0172868270 /NCGR_PEP_ID=MMETSP1075-20121228/85873_1 /TAXON_ID=2916 /ORGANISM="Ceratium fusus, Strain PA161109" /LENGTH=70 /DNA_ID=CAMNT_0013717827 /DNA_START=80 /DNA_END=289 /DNA_ORIENTATION=-
MTFGWWCDVELELRSCTGAAKQLQHCSLAAVAIHACDEVTRQNCVTLWIGAVPFGYKAWFPHVIYDKIVW